MQKHSNFDFNDEQRKEAIRLIAFDIQDAIEDPNNGELYDFDINFFKFATDIFSVLSSSYLWKTFETISTLSTAYTIFSLTLKKFNNLTFPSLSFIYEKDIKQIKEIARKNKSPLTKFTDCITHFVMTHLNQLITHNNSIDKPFLLLFSNSELEYQSWLTELQNTYRAQCDIGLINVENDIGILKYFDLTTLPAAILRLEYNKLYRLTGNFGLAEINSFLDEKLKKK